MLVEPQGLIVHVDADAFFASVEQLLIPALRRRPVVVGSGCIASCSYEARRCGLHAGMGLSQARRLCPQAVILQGDYQIYRCFAEHIWQVCRQYTCGLETYLDEAYGDATGMERLFGDPPKLGRRLQRQVRAEVGLPVSVGLAGNRMLAKLASHAAKPGGVAWIAPERAEAFVAALPVEDLPGVGHKTAAQLRDCNIRTVEQFRRLPRTALATMFGQRGELLYERARGRDVPLAEPAQAAAPPKTISRETTFHQCASDPRQIGGMLRYLLERGLRTARAAGLLAGALELTIRYDDWRQEAVRRTLPRPTGLDDELFAVALQMLEQIYRRRVSLRHLGIVLSALVPGGNERTLFDGPAEERSRSLCQALDAIRDRWGHSAVVSGESIELLGKLEQNEHGFVLRTPSLTK